MTDRALAYGVALVVVALALLAMGGLHDRHYRNRRWQMLEGRVDVLERIVRGDHD